MHLCNCKLAGEPLGLLAMKSGCEERLLMQSFETTVECVSEARTVTCRPSAIIESLKIFSREVLKHAPASMHESTERAAVLMVVDASVVLHKLILGHLVLDACRGPEALPKSVNAAGISKRKFLNCRGILSSLDCGGRFAA